MKMKSAETFIQGDNWIADLASTFSGSQGKKIERAMDKMQRLMRQHRIFALPMPGFMAKLDFELSMAFPYYMYFETNAQIDFN